MLAAILLVLVDRAVMAWRWALLLCISPLRPPVGRMLEVFFVSTFVGTFLPASIGADAVRAYSISRDRVAGADAVASVFMDRMLGVASLLIMGLVGLVLARDLSANGVVLAGLALTAAVSVLTMLMIFSERAGTWAARAASAMPFAVLRRMSGAIIE